MPAQALPLLTLGCPTLERLGGGGVQERLPGPQHPLLPLRHHLLTLEEAGVPGQGIGVDGLRAARGQEEGGQG